MAKSAREPSFVTPEFTLYFPEIAQTNELSGKYRVVAVFDEGEDLKAMKAAMKTAAVNKWGKDVPKTLQNPVKTPEQEKSPEYWPENTLHCALVTSQKPGLVDRNENIAVTADKFYPGCRCRAVVHVWAYDGVGSGDPGLTITLDLLQFVSDGERLGGGISAAKNLLAETPMSDLPDLPTDQGENSDDPLDF